MEYELNKEQIPAHVAIIMDGNGRWAKAKGLPRTAGHVEGVQRAKDITEEAKAELYKAQAEKVRNECKMQNA